MSQPLVAETWYEAAIIIMLEESLPLQQAAMLLDDPVVLTADEAARHMRRKSWRESFDRLSRQFFERKSSPTIHTKSRLIGQMIQDAERLRGIGKFKEAADVLKEVAKLEGWADADTNINIFDALNGAEMAKLAERLAAKKAEKVQ